MMVHRVMMLRMRCRKWGMGHALVFQAMAARFSDVCWSMRHTEVYCLCYIL